MASDGWRKLHCEHGESGRGMQVRIANGQGHSRNSGQQPKCSEGVYCVACNTHFVIGHGGRHDVKRHIGQHTSHRLSHVWAASIGLSLLAAKMTR